MKFKLLEEFLNNQRNEKIMTQIFLVFAIFIFQCCGTGGEKANKTEHRQDSVETDKVIANAEILVNYWEGYNFRDVEAIKDPNKSEQAFVDFISLFPRFDQSTVAEAVQKMLNQAKLNKMVFDFFVAQYEKYLYDPNSPMRNDLYYETVLVYLLDSDMLSDQEKTVKATVLKLVQKNQPGNEATDFMFLFADGQQGSLSSINSDLTVLFFYEPGCPHCEEAIAEMQQDKLLNQLIEERELTVLAVYPFGGLAIWKSYEKHLPANWLNVFDKDEAIVKNEKYDLKATPTIFLVDNDKRVLLKDIGVQQLLTYLSNNGA